MTAPKSADDRARKITYAVDPLPAGDRIVRSVGLEAVGQREIGAQVSAGMPHEADHQVMDVLQFVSDYVINSGARILAGQTFAYGWTMFRFNDARPNVLEIEEDAEPLGPDDPSHWGPGVWRAIFLRLAGDAVMRRNRLSGRAEHPNRGHFGVACTHITANYAGKLVAERGRIDRSTSPWDSGWTVHCGGEVHAQEDWQRHHLTHLAYPRPFLVPYLCMPEGSMVAFEKNRAIVWGPGSDSGALDPEDPREWHLI